MGDDGTLGNGQPQPEARSSASFAMHEWLEKCFQYFSRCTESLVADLYLVEIARIFQSDLHSAAGRRKAQCVAYDIFKGVTDKLAAARHNPFSVLRCDVEYYLDPGGRC